MSVFLKKNTCPKQKLLPISGLMLLGDKEKLISTLHSRTGS